MPDTEPMEASPPPKLQAVGFSDVFAAVREGFADFRRAPLFGLFFAAFYVAGGLILYLQLKVLAQSWWVIPLGMGFPLLGPFIAVGLYEVSRRLDAGEPLEWGGVLSVILRQRSRQIPMLAAMIITMFLIWIYLAHLIFALFFGLTAMTNITTSWQVVLSAEGAMMFLIGTAVGGALSFILFSATVIGLPLLLDREIDVVTAMIASFQLVLKNPAPMLFFGAMAGGLMLLGMLPFFGGLFIVLPVLGHATWRLYRRAVRF